MSKSYLNKLVVMVAAGLAVAALAVLAGGVSSLELQPGKGFPSFRSTPTSFTPSSVLWDPTFLFLLAALLIIIIIPAVIYIFLRYPNIRKRMLLQLITSAFWAAAMYFIIGRLREIFIRAGTEIGQPGDAVGMQTTELPGAENFVVEPNPGVFNFLSLSIALALVVVVGLVWWRYQVKRRARRKGPAVEFARSAQGALDDLRAGEDLRNVILRCYQDMSRIVAERKRVQREQYITPREFAEELEAAGLPSRDVQRLTRLFEAVRYGSKGFGEREESEAQLCLSSVIDALEVR